MRKRIITRADGMPVSVLFEDGKAIELSVPDIGQASFVGSVYTARVEHIVKNLNACFVEYLPGKTAWLDYSKNQNLKQGDSCTVQIEREAAGSKPPRATTEISLSESLAVLVVGACRIAVSSKIRSDELRKELSERFQKYVTEDYGFIIRSAAEEVSPEEVEAQILKLTEDYKSVKRGMYLDAFAKIYEPSPGWLQEIRDRDLTSDTEIVTDLPEVYEEAVKAFPEQKDRFRFYEDDKLSLYRLYSMEAVLSGATSRNVYLPCGGYLVIDRTEAMTVVDVNSGKAIRGNKDKEDNTLRVNLEAAAETARQMRLRNLCGIVAVDFIDQKKKANTEKVFSTFGGFLRQDPVKAAAVQMTDLQICLATRQKIRGPLFEQIRAWKNFK